MASVQTKYFLYLLGSVINPSLKEKINNDADWEEIFNLANAHNVTPLIFEEASSFDDFINYKDYSMLLFRSMTQVGEQTQNTQKFLNLYKAFSENGIYPIVMKGIVLRNLYGEFAESRPSGDEDILIRAEDFEKCDEILKIQGFMPKEENISFEQLNEVQEINYNSTENSFYIELHVNPMGKENALRNSMNSCFKDVFENYSVVDISETELRTMNITDHFLFIILHAFRHFTAGGFGVRQVLDILVYYKHYIDEIDWSYIEEKLKKFDAWLFFNDLIHIGNEYMGFNLKTFTKPVAIESMLNDLVDCGVFGLETQAQRTASQMTFAAVANKGKKESKIKTLFRTIFPKKEHFYNECPELIEKPWLILSLWIKRIFRFIIHSRANDGNLAKESMEISKKRIELLKQYKIL